MIESTEDQSSSQINKFSKLSVALDSQGLSAKDFVPPKNNAPESANVLGVYFLGDARSRPPSSGEPWTENEYSRLVMLTVRYPVTKPHRWKEISYALAVNPDPDDLEAREVKAKEQDALIEKNKEKKDKDQVVFESCYYCHGCGNKNKLGNTMCDR